MLDTNILVSAFIVAGTSREVFDAALSQDEVVLSKQLLTEFQQVMEAKLGYSRGEIERAINLLQEKGLLIPWEGTVLPIDEIQDSDDWVHLRFCEWIGADFLITGDKELLDLGQFGKTRIIPPSQYWKIRREP